MLSSDGVILKLNPLGENGFIVTWCTPLGIIQTAAKSARKSTSPFAGRLDLFYQCYLHWKPSTRSSLHTLTAVDVISPRLSLRQNFFNLKLAGYFSRLCLQVLEKDTPIPEFYDLLQRALQYLEQSEATQKALIHFENELVRLHGMSHPNIPAHVLLKSHFGKLPSQRDKLLLALPPEKQK